MESIKSLVKKQNKLKAKLKKKELTSKKKEITFKSVVLENKKLKKELKMIEEGKEQDSSYNVRPITEADDNEFFKWIIDYGFEDEEYDMKDEYLNANEYQKVFDKNKDIIEKVTKVTLVERSNGDVDTINTEVIFTTEEPESHKDRVEREKKDSKKEWDEFDKSASEYLDKMTGGVHTSITESESTGIVTPDEVEAVKDLFENEDYMKNDLDSDLGDYLHSEDIVTSHMGESRDGAIYFVDGKVKAVNAGGFVYDYELDESTDDVEDMRVLEAMFYNADNSHNELKGQKSITLQYGYGLDEHENGGDWDSVNIAYTDANDLVAKIEKELSDDTAFTHGDVVNESDGQPSYITTYETWDEESLEIGETDDKGEYDSDVFEDLEEFEYFVNDLMNDGAEYENGVIRYDSSGDIDNIERGELTVYNVILKNLTEDMKKFLSKF